MRTKKEIDMFTLEEIINMTPKELKENWDEVADSSLKLLGAREMTVEDKEHVDNTM
jgi:hypothetical protein